MRTLKYLKDIVKVIIPKKQRMLLRFSKTNVLDDTSSATEDEARRNIVKLMNPKEDEKAKDRIFIKINQAFNRIKNGTFSNRDKKVILYLHLIINRSFHELSIKKLVMIQNMM